MFDEKVATAMRLCPKSFKSLSVSHNHAKGREINITKNNAGFEWFDGGFVGVDVFFVISGYLITNIIISEMDKGTFSLINPMSEELDDFFTSIIFCDVYFSSFCMVAAYT